ncbi:redoxin domain-containing protein [Aureliella helgolandensis]|uniref:Thiol-disulfide oxidoreductase n=1 Tax=Aureliella helgolandensis TaxID=2527968 RepID=A0A518G6W8_9BACT|nr:redoxin domain-containing protein [Aureliella helgolandensis]QDV24338.1 thiol-disulfide oxidoreductase [Aureliella helgolandensis]
MQPRFTFMTALVAVGATLLAPGIARAASLAFESQSPQGTPVVLKPGGQAVVAVVFLGTECPMARAYASQLSELQSSYAAQGVRILGVMSNIQDDAEKLAKYASELDVQFELVHDADQQIADQYGAQRTPEAFVLDERLMLRYHGRIDDQYAPGIAHSNASRRDLQIAIEEILAGKRVSLAETRAVGCIIGRPKTPLIQDSADQNSSQGTTPDQAPTFTNEVVRVLARNCIECHRQGDIGPFSMERYEDVIGWADTMLETIEDERMPPWHASPEYGEFSNARHMSEEDKETLRQWVALGAPEGKPEDLPPPQQYVDGWLLPRTPDLVLPMREQPYQVPRDGVVEYQYFVVDPQFSEDKWIAAAQVLPGKRSVVHHAIVFVRPPDGADFSGIGWLAAYVPGQRNLPMPAGHARHIPAGSKLVFQMHYTPDGTVREDQTQVGLVFASPESVTHEVYTMIALDQELEIPPGVPSHHVEARSQTLPRNGTLLAVTPHMHYRGKAFRLFAGNTNSEILLDVPQYDFNWQHTYQFSRPISLSDIQQLSFRAEFDNSPSNPFNPDPQQWVHWGDQTWEEMAVSFFEVAEPRSTVSASQPPVSDSETSGNSPTRVAGSGPQSHQQDEQPVQSERQIKIEAYIARVMRAMDANGDGLIRKSEAAIVVRHGGFHRWDRDGNDLVTLEEIRQVAQGLYP